MEILHIFSELLHNLPEAASQSGSSGTGSSFNPSDWLPSFFGGTAGSVGNMVRERIKNQAQQQQDQQYNQDQEKQTDKRIHDLL